MAQAGKAKPVYRVSDGQLSGNGGSIKIVGNVASRAKFVDDEVAVSGKPQPVYIVTDADLVENGGPFKLRGGEPLKLKTIAGEPIRHGEAIPIYDIDPPAAAATVYFYDTFTDVNGTTLLVHTPDIDLSASGWTDGAGAYARTFEIQSNQAEVPLTGSTHGDVADSTVADKNMSFDVTTPPATLSSRILFVCPRWAGGVMLWAFAVRGNGDVEIIENNGGAVTRAASPGLLSPSTSYSATASVAGNVYTFTINGTTISYTDPGNFLISETQIALVSNDGRFKVDNLRVTD